MKIAAAQIKCRPGDVDTNVAKIAGQIELAASHSCDLVLLPEMVDTGYEMNVVMDKAATWDAGPVVQIRELAAKVGIAVCCGVSERVDDRVYNSQVFVDRNGTVVGHYRKAHLFTAAPIHEERFLHRGDELVTVDFEGFKLGLMICYDLRFPEMARALALRGVDVLLVSAAWPEIRIGHWRLLLVARAIENQAYVAAANLCGADGPFILGGNSVILDPSGGTVASGETVAEAMLLGELKREAIEVIRSHMAVFADRRRDLYGLYSE